MSETVNLPPEAAGKRADAALSEVLPQSRSQVTARIKSGEIVMDGKPFKPSVVVAGGEIFQVFMPSPRELTTDEQYYGFSLNIIFEDADIVVVNKPAGLLAHKAPRRQSVSVAGGLARRYQEHLSTLGGRGRHGIVHRLDKDTSGVMVAAKNDICHAALARQFAEREVSKEYAAIVCGEVKKNEGVFSSDIGRNANDIRRMTGKNPLRPRPSETRWEVAERGRGWSFVRVRPVSGRTHQIRVHFSEGGHPVVADSFYETKESKEMLLWAGLSERLTRQALHALSIGFVHPFTKKRVSFTAPLADDIQNALTFLRERDKSTVD